MRNPFVLLSLGPRVINLPFLVLFGFMDSSGLCRENISDGGEI